MTIIGEDILRSEQHHKDEKKVTDDGGEEIKVRYHNNELEFLLPNEKRMIINDIAYKSNLKLKTLKVIGMFFEFLSKKNIYMKHISCGYKGDDGPVNKIINANVKQFDTDTTRDVSVSISGLTLHQCILFQQPFANDINEKNSIHKTYGSLMSYKQNDDIYNLVFTIKVVERNGSTPDYQTFSVEDENDPIQAINEILETLNNDKCIKKLPNIIQHRICYMNLRSTTADQCNKWCDNDYNCIDKCKNHNLLLRDLPENFANDISGKHHTEL